MVLTDPPYFLDGLDPGWKKGRDGSTRATGTVGTLPVGMKFDPKQGIQLYRFLAPIASELHRVLKPGSFALCFSQPRLSHRVSLAFEEAGFEIRDQIAWHFTGQSQFKAFGQEHFVRRKNICESEKSKIILSLEGRKTPQLRPQHETIILAQKPREGTFVDNWQQWRTGLMDARKTLHGKMASNVMVVEKPRGEERRSAGGHLTPKPIELLGHLIELFSSPDQLIIDPFLGSGSTAVAAIRTGRSCLGIEIMQSYATIAERRVRETGLGGL
jgi:DNA modification methylase